MRMNSVIRIMSVMLVAVLASCGGSKEKSAETFDDEDVVGNPAKIAFVEDFYEKYYTSKDDAEALGNLVENVLTDHALELVGELAGEGDLGRVFVPASLDTITDRSQVSIEVEPQDLEDDLLYNVKISGPDGVAHSVVVAVVGSDGEFMVDSISNPDL